jgi:hypothetical protein
VAFVSNLVHAAKIADVVLPRRGGTDAVVKETP